MTNLSYEAYLLRIGDRKDEASIASHPRGLLFADFPRKMQGVCLDAHAIGALARPHVCPREIVPREVRGSCMGVDKKRYVIATKHTCSTDNTTRGVTRKQRP